MKEEQSLLLSLVVFGELDGLEDLFYSLLEELHLHGLYTLVIVNEMIVHNTITLNGIEDTTLEEAFTAGALLYQLTGNLATLSAIDDHTLVAEVRREGRVNATIEHEAVIIELLHARCCRQRGSWLVVVLLDEGLSDGEEGLRVTVLELQDGMCLIDWLLDADMLL